MSKTFSSNSTLRSLTEMPALSGSVEPFDLLKRDIEEVKSVENPRNLNNDLKKIEHGGEVFYWYEKDQTILLGVILTIRRQSLVVSLLGKNPQFKDQPPYASDLYMNIVEDNPDKKILSDSDLSMDAFKLWIKLFDLGYVTSVYDTQSKKYIKIKNKLEFNKYTGADSKERYRYVLSKPKQSPQSIQEVQRLAQLAGVSLKS